MTSWLSDPSIYWTCTSDGYRESQDGWVVNSSAQLVFNSSGGIVFKCLIHQTLFDDPPVLATLILYHCRQVFISLMLRQPKMADFISNRLRLPPNETNLGLYIIRSFSSRFVPFLGANLAYFEAKSDTPAPGLPRFDSILGLILDKDWFQTKIDSRPSASYTAGLAPDNHLYLFIPLPLPSISLSLSLCLSSPAFTIT